MDEKKKAWMPWFVVGLAGFVILAIAVSLSSESDPPPQITGTPTQTVQATQPAETPSEAEPATEPTYTPTQFQATATAEATATADEQEERRKGFHCLSPWDGNHDGLEALIREQLNDPGSMETLSTRITPVLGDGRHKVQLEFTAKNAFGGTVRHTAHGWVYNSTCEAELTSIE